MQNLNNRFNWFTMLLVSAVCICMTSMGGAARAISDPGGHTPWNSLDDSFAWSQDTYSGTSFYFQNNNANSAFVTVRVVSHYEGHSKVKGGDSCSDQFSLRLRGNGEVAERFLKGDTVDHVYISEVKIDQSSSQSPTTAGNSGPQLCGYAGSSRNVTTRSSVQTSPLPPHQAAASTKPDLFGSDMPMVRLADDAGPSLADTIQYIKDRCGSQEAPIDVVYPPSGYWQSTAWISISSSLITEHITYNAEMHNDASYTKTITFFVKGLDSTIDPLTSSSRFIQHLHCRPDCPANLKIQVHLHYTTGDSFHNDPKPDNDSVTDEETIYDDCDDPNFEKLEKAFHHLMILVNGPPRADPFG